MFDMTLLVDCLELNVENFSKTLANVTRAALRQAAREFIKAGVIAVPVDSGMSRGSFLNIGRLLRVAIPIEPKRSGLTYYGPPRLPKTPESGASLATPGPDILYENGYSFGFHYSNDVIHYNINEFFSVVPGAPWLSYDAGETAAMNYLRNRLPRIIPRLKNYMVITTIIGGPNGLTRRTARFTREGEIPVEGSP